MTIGWKNGKTPGGRAKITGFFFLKKNHFHSFKESRGKNTAYLFVTCSFSLTITKSATSTCIGSRPIFTTARLPFSSSTSPT
jgi:hypothetical protein